MGDAVLGESGGRFCYAVLELSARSVKRFRQELEKFWQQAVKIPVSLHELEEAILPANPRAVVVGFNLASSEFRAALRRYWKAEQVKARRTLGDRIPREKNLIWLHAVLTAVGDALWPTLDRESLELVHFRYDQWSMKQRERQILESTLMKRLPYEMARFLSEPREFAVKTGQDLFHTVPRIVSVRPVIEDPFVNAVDCLVRKAHQQLQVAGKVSLPGWIEYKDATHVLERFASRSTEVG
jgi:hypothetical protein